MMQPATLLLTRPRAASERFAVQLREELGITDIVISPLLEIEFLPIGNVPKDALIVFTSRNGVEAWAHSQLVAQRNCICVGQATADAARDLGFETHVSGGTVDHIYADLCKDSHETEIIHIHGRHTRGDLVERLASEGLQASGMIAYEQKTLELSEEARALLIGGAPVIVPLFSPRSAAQFASSGPFGPQIDIIAISQAAADPCPDARIAPSPDARGMIAAISSGYAGVCTP